MAIGMAIGGEEVARAMEVGGTAGTSESWWSGLGVDGRKSRGRRKNKKGLVGGSGGT